MYLKLHIYLHRYVMRMFSWLSSMTQFHSKSINLQLVTPNQAGCSFEMVNHTDVWNGADLVMDFPNVYTMSPQTHEK